MYNVKDVDAVKRNCRAFWNKEFIGRPFVQLTAPKNGTVYPDKDLSYVRRVKAAQNGDFTSVVSDYAEVAQTIMHYGESVPFYNADLCPDQYAAFFGAEIEARDGQFTTWIKRHVADTLAELDLTFDRNNPVLVQLERSIREATRIADGHFLICVPDYHSNLDTLSALLSPTNLCFELADNPDLLEQKLRMINDCFKPIYDIFFEAGRMDELGSLSWLPIYCEGRFSIIQCDFSCMISPEDARRFVIPSIEKEAESLDRCIYHYDGKQALGHFEDVLAIDKLDGIQWVPGTGQPRTIEWMDLLKRIQAKGKSVWVYDWTKEEILADTQLDPRLTMFTLAVGSEAEAEAFMEQLERKYR